MESVQHVEGEWGAWGEWNAASGAKSYLLLNEPGGKIDHDKWFWGFLSPQARMGDR